MGREAAGRMSGPRPKAATWVLCWVKRAHTISNAHAPPTQPRPDALAAAEPAAAGGPSRQPGLNVGPNEALRVCSGHCLTRSQSRARRPNELPHFTDEVFWPPDQLYHHRQAFPAQSTGAQARGTRWSAGTVCRSKLQTAHAVHTGSRTQDRCNTSIAIVQHRASPLHAVSVSLASVPTRLPAELSRFTPEQLPGSTVAEKVPCCSLRCRSFLQYTCACERTERG